MFPTIPFSFLFVLLNFIGISFGVPSYEWDSTGTVRNVQTFANFIDDLYTEYSKSDRMDSIFDAPYEYYTTNQKRAVFNFTFAKCSAEIAYFRVINANADRRPFRNFNVVRKMDKNFRDGFLHYGKSLAHQIANAFEREIFVPAKEQKIAKTVENQIMQLAFSFAARALLWLFYDRDYADVGVGAWQLHTLLSAFKILSAQNANIENGIFPFQIIKIQWEGNNYLWKKKLLFDGDNAETSKQQKEQQKHYIEDFNFILRLSDFELTSYEILKVLDQIMMNKQHQGGNDVTAICTFMMDHFRALLSKEGGILNKIKMDNRLQCAMAFFGHALSMRLDIWSHGDFSNYYIEKKEKCEKDLNQIILQQKDDDDMPSMEMFQVQLMRHVLAIKIDANIIYVVKQICDYLRNVLAAVLSKQNKNQIKSFTQTNEFKLFLNEFQYHFDDMYSMMKDWSKTYDKKKSLDEKIDALKELQKILDQLLEEYSRANSLQLNEKIIFQNDENAKIPTFGQIFYEMLQKYNGEDNVRYDEQRQLLTFPMEIGEHLISRLCTFMERNLPLPSFDNIEDDFVSAMDAITSSRDNLESQKRIKIFGLTAEENMRSFEWLFTLALRLCWQIKEPKNFAEKYVPILHAHVTRLISSSYYFDDIFEYKINVDKNLVRINLPNWNMPYEVYLEDENELKEQRATKLFQFFSSLFKYSPTIFDVVKMAKILDVINAENGHIWIGPLDPKIFLFILQKITNSAQISYKINKMLENENISADKIELPVANSFCFLAHFVVQLLEKAIDGAEYLLNIEFVKVFIDQNKTFCTEEQIKKETMKIFGDNVVNIGKQIKIDFDLNTDVQQKILPDLIEELETMISNENWNCVDLLHVKAVEWNLLEKGLMENGQSGEWEEIKELMDNWTTEFNRAFSEGKRVNFQKTVEELKAKLENLKEKLAKWKGKKRKLSQKELKKDFKLKMHIGD